MYKIGCAKLEVGAECDWVRLVNGVDTEDRCGCWIMHKIALAGMMAKEGRRKLIHSAGEKSLEEVICSEYWQSGPVHGSGIDDGVNIDVPLKPAGNS